MYQIMKLDNLTLLNAASNVPGCTYGEPFIYLISDLKKKTKNKTSVEECLFHLPDNVLKNPAMLETQTNRIGLFGQT